MKTAARTRRDLLRGVGALAGTAALSPRFAIAQSKAEVDEVVLAPQYGIAYLPLHIIREQRLLEKHLAKNGLPNTKVAWAQTTGGATANDALISGTMHVVGGGVGPMLTIWDKTRGNIGVRGICSFDSTNLYLNTINPAVKTIKDFGENDRIAMPAVKISIQAVTLQMAAEKIFGEGKHDALDRLTVSMSHPDGTAALLSGKSEITGHFTSPPFQFQQLEDKRVHKVLSNFEVLGGPVTFNSPYATARFRNENPRTYKAVFDSLVEAQEFIQKNRSEAIRIYIEVEKSKLAPDFIAQMMDTPDIKHTMVPQNTIKYAHFMHKVGMLRTRAESFKDYYFPDVHDLAGS
jgi:NitT/TauT family transport system substrate-binding protein